MQNSLHHGCTTSEGQQGLAKVTKGWGKRATELLPRADTQVAALTVSALIMPRRSNAAGSRRDEHHRLGLNCRSATASPSGRWTRGEIAVRRRLREGGRCWCRWELWDAHRGPAGHPNAMRDRRLCRAALGFWSLSRASLRAATRGRKLAHIMFAGFVWFPLGASTYCQ